jgi:hypothetical protein
MNWAKLARACAKDAHENYFPSRRGIWYFADVDKLCIYNNNPYAGHPQLRDEETAAIREWLAAKGIRELAYATYPDAGYTYAIIIDASEDMEDEIVEGCEEIVGQSIRRVYAELQSR